MGRNSPQAGDAGGIDYPTHHPRYASDLSKPFAIPIVQTSMWHAIQRTYRGLIQRPTFFLAVVFTMALGIGANSSIFPVIDAVLLKPLPYPGGDRLMAIFESSPRLKVPRGPVAPPRLEEWNRMNQTFAGISGAYTESQAETSGPLPERLVCARAAPRFFSVLGTPALVGRGFSPDEEVANGPRAAVISERLWKRRFNADPQVAGRMLRFADRGFPIVGVMPDAFRFPADDVDVWLSAKLPDVVMRSREARFYSAVGRIKEGVTVRAAQADLAAVQGRLGARVSDAELAEQRFPGRTPPGPRSWTR